MKTESDAGRCINAPKAEAFYNGGKRISGRGSLNIAFFSLFFLLFSLPKSAFAQDVIAPSGGDAGLTQSVVQASFLVADRSLAADDDDRSAALKAKYDSGRVQQKVGNILWISGSAAAVGGIGLLIAGAVEKNDAVVGIGAATILAGGILFNAGIPISIVGTVRKNSAYRAMRAEGFADFQPDNDAAKKAAAAPKLSLNLHGNSAGFAFVF